MCIVAGAEQGIRVEITLLVLVDNSMSLLYICNIDI